MSDKTNTNISAEPGSHFSALVEVSKEINSISDFDELILRILRIAIETLNAERGFVVLAREGCGDLELVAARNLAEESVLDATDLSTRIVQQALESKEGLISHDAQVDPRFKGAQSVMFQNIRSVAAVPLTIKDRAIGAIYVDSIKSREMFTAESLRFLEAFANHAGIAIQNARRYESLVRENLLLKREMADIFPLDEIIGESPSMRDIFRLIDKVARSDVTVLIEGESGTGKELVARAIHASSPRRNQMFVAQYCGALAETLLESELFGYKKGAFTGAMADKKGLFEIADGGTFFLDEISDISLALQTKLLRVLQEGEIRPVGDTRTRMIDVRIISATNRSLDREVSLGTFRQDLFYRLKVITIHVPPLRERGNDVIQLADHFLKRYRTKYNPEVKGFTKKAMKTLQDYHWPGNVRELENVIQRALVICDDPMIDVPYLSLVDQGELGDEQLSLKEIQRRAVGRALRKYGGNRARAAEALGVSLRWLQYRIKEWEL